MTSCMSRYLRQKGEALVNEQTDGQSSGVPKNPITYIQVCILYCGFLVVYNYHMYKLERVL